MPTIIHPRGNDKGVAHPTPEGGWRAERRKPMVSAILADHGGRLAARQLQRLFGTGPRFPVPAMAGRSSSSWQGLVVVPGGAPLPPECLVATRPAGAAPRPAIKTPLERAP
jgi:hypothetical protein